MTNPNDSEMRLLSRTHLLALAQLFLSFFFLSLFDTAPAAGARTATTAVTFPADSSLSTFHRFPLLPDPDHILPHGGGGDILQWGRVFSEALIVAEKSREASAVIKGAGVGRWRRLFFFVFFLPPHYAAVLFSERTAESFVFMCKFSCYRASKHMLPARNSSLQQWHNNAPGDTSN